MVSAAVSRTICLFFGFSLCTVRSLKVKYMLKFSMVTVLLEEGATVACGGGSRVGDWEGVEE